jgi:hypothetical protein
MAAAAVGLLFLTPSISTFYDGITSRPMWASLNARMLPKDSWFGVVLDRHRVAVNHDASAAPSSTGSLQSAVPPSPAAVAPTPSAP